MKKEIFFAAIIFHLLSKGALADEFNYSFIRGGSKDIPDILDSNKKNVPGKYVVDVIFNGSKIASSTDITITKEDANELCLSDEWLTTNGITIRKAFYKDVYNAARQCYVLGNEKNSKVAFDQSLQEVSIDLPQAGYADSASEGDVWDYGSNGFKLDYDVNTAKSSSQDRTTYSSVEGQVNLGEWVLLGRGYSYQGEHFDTNNLLLTRAIKSIKSDLQFGKSQLYNSLNDGFTFYGAQLKSNQDMYSWDSHAYSPIINGIAHTHARVTIEQSGYTLKSIVVPPGPFTIDDINGVYSGDLIMKIYEEDGSVREQRFPVAVLPNLLRPGTYNYSIAVGSKENQSDGEWDKDSLFAQMSYDYGFEPFTLNSSVLLDKNYNNVGLGVIRSFGWFGAMSFSGNLSQAKYHNGENLKGFSTSLKYAKALGDNANLQLIGYRFNSENYIDYADFTYKYYSFIKNRPKQRYETIVTYQLPENSLFLNLSAWKEDYWDNYNEVGANVSLTKSFNQVTMTLNGGYSKLQDMETDYNVGLSVSVPFSLFDKTHYSYSNINYDRRTGTSVNTGVSGTVNQRLSYNASVNQTRSTTGGSVSASYLFDWMQTAATFAKTGNDTSTSFQVGGSVVGVPDAGLIFTPVKNDQLAVVQMKDVPGVMFNGSLPGDKYGRAVIPLTAYNKNTISVNAEKLPKNVELTENAINVTPTENAIIYKKVKYKRINTYIVKLYGKNGFVVPMGSIAKNTQDREVGYVNNGGILLMNLEDSDEGLISLDECKFNTQSLKKDFDRIQEIHCE
ncbi:PefC/AfrB family outer membrane usher protein [Citrobacter amalonaticus]|uniref:PefC/AfrB family outer membrane usher protein n=1 Tax=Citrobacter amalonaticus TaxID=35703 RepID=UPI00255AE234|nr:PefC/AfrB family outer membrane usher protein [Citrobacter amalonaticus]MDL4619956.1 PefC/AfrB family outer membrane usher protein [Citrobacter amalonaticus]MDL4624054.1 PefC/AfrB family outer membrane usher protein [Citrobacter amalonaticus]